MTIVGYGQGGEACCTSYCGQVIVPIGLMSVVLLMCSIVIVVVSASTSLSFNALIIAASTATNFTTRRLVSGRWSANGRGVGGGSIGKDQCHLRVSVLLRTTHFFQEQLRLGFVEGR